MVRLTSHCHPWAQEVHVLLGKFSFTYWQTTVHCWVDWTHTGIVCVAVFSCRSLSSVQILSKLRSLRSELRRVWPGEGGERRKLFWFGPSAFFLHSPPYSYKNLPVKRQVLTLAVDKSRKTLMHKLTVSMEVVYKCVSNLLVLEMSAVVPICLLISILKTFTVYICHKGKLPSTIQRYYWKSSIVFVFGAVFHFQYMHRSSFLEPLSLRDFFRLSFTTQPISEYFLLQSLPCAIWNSL